VFQLPLIFIGGKEWYPIEFLFQTFQKTKDANDKQHVQDLLKHFDGIAGNKYVEEISKLVGQLSIEQERVNCGDIFRQFNLQRSLEPLQLSAKILGAPRLKFGKQDASVENGDWNLRNVKFSQ